jgi:hypothetical protein
MFMDLGTIIFCYDIQRYASNDQVYDKLFVRKVVNECNNFRNSRSNTEGSLIV